jgi:hypothetical protein
MTCSSSVGQTLKPPAAAGAALVASSAAYWLAVVPVRPSCVAAFLPGLILGRAGAGLAQAPLFAAASSLQADRATSGSAVLNVSRQLGSAVGVALWSPCWSRCWRARSRSRWRYSTAAGSWRRPRLPRPPWCWCCCAPAVRREVPARQRPYGPLAS